MGLEEADAATAFVAAARAWLFAAVFGTAAIKFSIELANAAFCVMSVWMALWATCTGGGRAAPFGRRGKRMGGRAVTNVVFACGGVHHAL